MNARTRIWWIWGFWAFLTFLPLLSALVMVFLEMGFRIEVWLVSLVIAVFAFVKAMQATARMRQLANNLKIGRWLNTTKRKRDLARKSDSVGRPQPGHTPERRSRRIGNERDLFHQRKFWKGLDHSSVVRHVGDLFHLLGMAVTNSTKLERSGSCLLLDGETLVEFVDSATRLMPVDVGNFASYVDSKPSCRRGVLVAAHGFKRSVLQYADNTSLILLDARDLARLGEHLLSE